jgi:predicted metal-dependent TIM-barrel fold hydrolase
MVVALQKTGPDMESRKVDRAAVRELVRKNAEELAEYAKAGGNAHQKVLDQHDQIEETISDLSLEDRVAFYTVYNEELNAKNAGVKLESAKSLHVAAQQEEEDANLGRLVWGVIIALIFVFIYLSMKK